MTYQRASDDPAAVLHESVLSSAVVEFLQPRSGGYLAVDCTVGAGGHSSRLLERSAPDGRLLGLDADAAALSAAGERLAPFGDRARLVHANYRDLGRVAAELGVVDVDAVLFDLGLSSMQLERAGRGFTFREDEPLDMRFDVGADGPTAADLLNTLEEKELERIFRAYGEEPRARRLAGAVADRRRDAPLLRTADLVSLVTRVLGPKRGRIHPATRIFQALRVAVNEELEALEEGLAAAVRLVRAGGRVAVISFHSLEDRIVKWRFREWAAATPDGPPLVRILTRKPLVPSQEETERNPRARSAKLRVAERLPDGGARVLEVSRGG